MAILEDKKVIFHIISGLEAGGAELMLLRLLEKLHQDPDYQKSYRLVVISLTSGGYVGERLRELGIEVQFLGMKSVLDIPRVLWQLRTQLIIGRADIVQTWMYHADLLGGLAARFAGITNVIWGLRGTAIPQTGWSATRLIITLCAWTSHFIPRAIVACAESARTAHIELGYDRSRMLVITNGYQLNKFQVSPSLRREARARFELSDQTLVVGIVGRFDPLKDYQNFVRAAGLLTVDFKESPRAIRFLMVGRGIDAQNKTLATWLEENNIRRESVLAGELQQVQFAYAAMDIFCLSSAKEGFPNVVCEAMAMQVPCVVTRAGDAAEIVGQTGIVVVPRDAKALAAALLEMSKKDDSERAFLGMQARQRIENFYSIETATARFAALYEKLTAIMASTPSKVQK
jgi:glycosyltransferase involved in cell wall biosynthesis